MSLIAISYHDVNKVISRNDFEIDHSSFDTGQLHFHINFGSGLSIKDEMMLFKHHKIYRDLMIKDDNKTISENERKLMNEIYYKQVNKRKAKHILSAYKRSINNNANPKFRKWFEKIFS